MSKKIDCVFDTEFLVVGGSGAGVTAAFYASQAGIDVLMVSKGKAGFSGNAIMAGGGCGIDGESGRNELKIETADPSFTKDKLFDCLIKESYYLAEQNVVQQYVDDAPVVLKDYLQWAERAGSKFVNIQPCGWQASGAHFAKPLVEALKETPAIRTLQDTRVVDLLKKNGRVVGALAIHIYSGKLIRINAKAVVLASGGYQLQSLKNTVSDMTGDGPAMAYRAGATISDMEFMLAFPTALVPEDMRGSIYPYLFRRIPHRLIDRNGDEIVIDEDARGLSTESKLNKIVNCFYMGNAVDKGLGGPHGGAFWDYSIATQEEKRTALDQFYKRFSTWHKYGYYKGESLARVEKMIMNNEPLEVGLGVEYSMGGIVVNEKMETGIEGLYAAGETTTGTFGACRIGDGLIEMLCQGMKAGKVAAEYCKSATLETADDEQAESLAKELLRFFDNENGENAIELFDSITSACDKGLKVIRREADLQSALAELTELKKKIPNAVLTCKSRVYNLEWLNALSARNTILCGEMAVRAALERRESRGCHMRADYPAVDHDHYLFHYDFAQKSGEMRMSTRKPTVTRIPLPNGQRENIIKYFTDPTLEYNRAFKINFNS